jgi:hypothetical protein
MIDDLRFAIRMLGRERWLTAVAVSRAVRLRQWS